MEFTASHVGQRIREAVLASANQGKLTELTELLQATGVRIRAQSDFGVSEAAETGLSFVENAILKARNAAAQTGLPAIADDSGLEVDVLGGAPGIFSARYAGPGASDRENLEKLLDKLGPRPAAERTARYYCVVVLLLHAADPTPVICEGAWEGSIQTAPTGTGGFGYDPIFYVPSHGKSAAELDSATKNRLSHRGQALAKLALRLA